MGTPLKLLAIHVLQDKQGRIRSACPPSALLAQLGSATMPRPTHTKSVLPAVINASATSGWRITPPPRIGIFSLALTAAAILCANLLYRKPVQYWFGRIHRFHR